MYDENDKTFLIGNLVIQVWEGQHPHEHDHCWKWSIMAVDDGSILNRGFTDNQWDSLMTALTAATNRGMFGYDTCEVDVLYKDVIDENAPPGFPDVPCCNPALAHLCDRHEPHTQEEVDEFYAKPCGCRLWQGTVPEAWEGKEN